VEEWRLALTARRRRRGLLKRFCHISRSPLAPLAPVFRRPVQAAKLDSHFPLRHRALVSLDHVISEHDDVLALVVIDQVQVLQRRYDVFLLDAGFLANFAAMRKEICVKCVRQYENIINRPASTYCMALQM